MAENPEREVLSSLPRSRPARRSAKRAPAREPGGPPDPPPRAPVPPSGWATPGDAGGAPPGPVEVVTTAVRAAGEVAAIGAAVGTHAVRNLLRHLPRP